MHENLLPQSTPQWVKSLWAMYCAHTVEATQLPLHHLMSPDLCPESFLPYLAYGIGLPGWSSELPVDAQRQRIRDWYEVSGLLGTRTATERAIAPFNIPYRLEESWQTDPPLPDGVASLALVPDEATTAPLSGSLVRAVREAANGAKRMEILLGTVLQFDPAANELAVATAGLGVNFIVKIPGGPH